jgi:hypothetical protein
MKTLFPVIIAAFVVMVLLGIKGWADEPQPCPSETFCEFFSAAVLGKPLPDLEKGKCLSKVEWRLIQRSVSARRGLPLKDKSLFTYFYGPGARPCSFGFSLKDRKSTEVLSDIDKQNIAAISKILESAPDIPPGYESPFQPRNGWVPWQFTVKDEYLLMMGVFEYKAQLIEFKKLVGKDYEAFLDRFHMVTNMEVVDDFEATVTPGGVRGLFSVMEGVVMVTWDGKIWAAILVDGKVKYYTNVEEYINKLPKTIEQWLPTDEIVYMGKGESGKSKGKWQQGVWTGVEQYRHSGSEVKISNLTRNQFHFSIDSYNGSHTCGAEGTGKLDGNRAVFIDEEDLIGCQIDFLLMHGYLIVHPNLDCRGYCGLGAGFNGEYKLKK